MRITDRAFVRRELRALKEAGIYPYRADPKLVYQNDPPRKAFVMRKLLPHRAGFFLVNTAFRWKNRKDTGQEEPAPA